ncbi:hypothetical protein HDU93_003616, partial [Gonapodya sp. JEL0774]
MLSSSIYSASRPAPATLVKLPPFRHEHIGSFLRPKEVLDAREKNANGTLNDAGLRAIEDVAIKAHVEQLLKAGVKDITDGEFRRQYFHFDFLKQLEGISIVHPVISHADAAKGVPPIKLTVTSRIKHVKNIEVDNFLFLKSLVPADRHADIKITIPSPTMIHFRAGRGEISSDAYPDDNLHAFFEDVAQAYREEIQALYDAGCRYIQLDDTNLAYLTDETMRGNFQKQRSEDPDVVLKNYAALINASISTAPPDMVVGIHLCKGNYKSTYFAQGSSAGYEPIASVLFGEVNVNAYFLEWEDGERSGKDFSALRHLPPTKVVVLGLVSSKYATLEDETIIRGKLEEASKVVPAGKEQIALSPQCGFSSTVEGNAIQPSDQYKKLQLCAEIAKDYW